LALPETTTTAAEPEAAEEDSLLLVQGLQTGYGQKQVVFDADLHVQPREVVGIVGHNGAGKTTTLQAIFGMLGRRAGKVVFRGEDTAKRTCHQNVLAGMSLARSERFVFGELSVHENLQLGGLWTPAAKAEALLEEVYELFPILQDRMKQRAGQFSGGEQRMLSIGMALMADPKLILFDEPSLGIAPALVTRVFKALRNLVDERGLSILIVEQNVPQLLAIVDRVYVMRSGRIVLEEPVEVMRAREQFWDLF
jgi:branched-chain amino acid transport system ATP-binding protein